MSGPAVSSAAAGAALSPTQRIARRALPAAPAIGPLALLIVEDDEGDFVYLSACVEELGLPASSVRWARTLAEGRAAATARPDCVLVDLGLPDASGVESVQAMVAAAPDAAVIVLTGLNDLRGEEALAAGAQDYLGKDGLSAELLSRCIRYALERKRTERTARQLAEVRLRSQENARLERGLLPRPLLRAARVSCTTTYQPGHGNAVLGGDFYDVIERPDGSIRVLIGDVMGHGPDEAAIGVHLRVAWRALVLAGIADDDVFAELQQLLEAEALPHTTFATACDLTITPGLDAVVVRSAGHPGPIAAWPGRVAELRPELGAPLGVQRSGRWPQTRFPLSPGWQLMLYTDGLLDAFRNDADAADIGLDALLTQAALSARPDARDWMNELISRATQSVDDDLAVVVVAQRLDS